MGLFRSFWRFISTLGGLLQGSTERATDAMLAASADTIRAQFRKTREDWVGEYKQMESAVAELVKIHSDKNAELEKLKHRQYDLTTKMKGAIELFKSKKDESMRDAYGKYAAEKEQTTQRATTLTEEIVNQEQIIENYKSRLMALKKSIDDLKEEEAQTIADIVSSRKLKELNSKLQGLSVDTQSKNLEAIREARKTAVATATLSSDLSGVTQMDEEAKMMQAGQSSSYMSEFDEAVKIERIFPTETVDTAPPEEKTTTTHSGNTTDDKLAALFKD